MSAVTRHGRAAVAMALLATASCRSTSVGDLRDLAAEPPLPYSVLVTGGAFLEFAVGAAEPPPLGRTYRPEEGLAEAVSLEQVRDVLATANVFVQAAGHEVGSPLRQAMADLEGPVGADDTELQRLLSSARSAGHDLLVVVEGLRDAPIVRRGVNGQWPITASVWLLMGLGMLIPDHTYESGAELDLAVRDVYSGRELYTGFIRPGEVDLALIDRTDVWGLISSIIVPPFWVGDDVGAVETKVRDTTTGRLLVSVARSLKSRDVRRQIEAQLPAVLSFTTDGEDALVEVDAAESLSAVRVRSDGTVLDTTAAENFMRELLGSEQQETTRRRWAYRGRLPLAEVGSRLQVSVQTVFGRAASATVLLR
ncbi:MAG: hypothetical protein AAF628_25760 [Planctomycetota bacterium]